MGYVCKCRDMMAIVWGKGIGAPVWPIISCVTSMK